MFGLGRVVAQGVTYVSRKQKGEVVGSLTRDRSKDEIEAKPVLAKVTAPYTCLHESTS